MSTDNSMTEFDDYFKPKFVNTKNVPVDGIRGTIVAAGFEEVGPQRERKPVLRIVDEDDQPWAFVVNQGNGATLNSLHGRGFERWDGKPITLIVGQASYQGRMVDSVVVAREDRPHPPKAQVPVKASPPAPPARPNGGARTPVYTQAEVEADPDIPF